MRVAEETVPEADDLTDVRERFVRLMESSGTGNGGPPFVVDSITSPLLWRVADNGESSCRMLQRPAERLLRTLQVRYRPANGRILGRVR